jgi:2'-5' RNA ligase
MAAVRTFIAVTLDASLQPPIEALINKLATSRAGVKWVAPHNIHVTLKFLGNVDENRLPDVYAACERAAVGSEPIDLEIKTLGCFPGLKRPRVVWVGIEKGQDAIKQLQKKVEQELARIGFPKEDRKFQAHLTIGRVKDQKAVGGLRPLIEEEQNVVIGSMRVEKFSVIKSKTLPTGPVYEELKAVPLTSNS